MDRRRNPRMVAHLPVRVWGMDANGLPFIELVHVRNLSAGGAVLHGLRKTVRKGELLDVQLDGHPAQFRVVWAGAIGGRRQGEVGLQRLEAEPFIGQIELTGCSQIAARG
jgi:hypothetical protein